VLTLWELLLRTPNAERYAIFQDDLLAYKNLRGYLEQLTLESKTYWNLYTVPMNHDRIKTVEDEQGRKRGIVGWHRAAYPGKGALALVFSREGVLALFSGEAGKHMVERVIDSNIGRRNIDGGVADSMEKVGYTELVHWPSLVQHTGRLVSTIGTSAQRREATEWHGENFDALSLLERN
jgi:hypothetical protein